MLEQTFEDLLLVGRVWQKMAYAFLQFLKQKFFIMWYGRYTMADEKLQMPSSGGGLVKYFDDYKSKIRIKPQIIIGMIILVIVVELILYARS